jgi:hypothetical protein
LPLEARAFLIARQFHARVRVFVHASRPPVLAALPPQRLSALLIRLRFRRRRPQAVPFEPAQRHIRLRALQLAKRRQERFLLARAKSRRRVARDNHPVRKGFGHR